MYMYMGVFSLDFKIGHPKWLISGLVTIGCAFGMILM